MSRTVIRVGVADDDAMLRAGIRRYFSTCQDVVVVGEAASAAEALELVRSLEVDVLVLDYNMPDQTGLQVLPQVLSQAAHTRVILFSGHSEDMLRERSLKAGAVGFVQKWAGPEGLLEAIRAAVAR